METIETLGKYEIKRPLGRGAMGTVYEGWDPIIARRVAIKTVKLPDASEPEAAEALARFRREAQAAGRLTHPNIVGVFDYGETNDLAYIVMEFVDGPPLKAVLDMAGVQAGSRQVAFDGMDTPVMDTTPDFVKALDIDHARDGEVMLAYSMNGEDLPLLNGFPLRLVVPGYYGTYWVKHLNEITVIDTIFDGFWMKSAYRIPDTPCNCVEPGTAPTATATIPINRLTVRSFITNVTDDARLKARKTTTLRGIAFDGGKGIKDVAVSTDNGATWTVARLGRDLGRYSFREWKLPIKLAPGIYDLRVRATNNAGDTQPMEPRWNPAGYLRNVVETVRVTAA